MEWTVQAISRLYREKEMAGENAHPGADQLMEQIAVQLLLRHLARSFSMPDAELWCSNIQQLLSLTPTDKIEDGLTSLLLDEHPSLAPVPAMES